MTKEIKTMEHILFGRLRYLGAWTKLVKLTIFGRECSLMLLFQGDDQGVFDHNQVLAYQGFFDNLANRIFRIERAAFRYYEVMAAEFRGRPCPTPGCPRSSRRSSDWKSFTLWSHPWNWSSPKAGRNQPWAFWRILPGTTRAAWPCALKAKHWLKWHARYPAVDFRKRPNESSRAHAPICSKRATRCGVCASRKSKPRWGLRGNQASSSS